MPFAKGKSGNPGGRRRAFGIRALARVDSHEAYQTLVEVMRNGEKGSERAAAAVRVLQLAGASFASDTEEAAAQAEAGRTMGISTAQLERLAIRDKEPLN